MRKPIKSFTPLWFLNQKNLGRNFFFYVVTTAIRPSRGIFWLKVIFLRKVMFVHLFWSLSNFFCLLTKKSGCQRNNLLIQKKKLEERFFKKIVFLINFGLPAEKFEQVNKKNSQNCQNYFQSVQRNNFRTFLWNEETLLKFCGRWANLLDFRREFFDIFFSKLQPTGAAEGFEVFLKRKVIVWSFSVSERK